MLTRRDALIRSGLLLAGSLLAGPTTVVAQDEPADPRDLFDLDPSLIHMGGLYIASHPAPVREAIERHRRGLDRDPVGYLQGAGPRNEAAVLRAAASYLKASPTDIALTDSTTMGLALLYKGIEVRVGQEILTTTHDFYVTHEPLQQRASEVGATFRQVDLYARPDYADEERIVGALERAITPRTRVVAVTWVHSSTGVKLPIGRLAEVVGSANRGRDDSDRALLCVDGVHGFGVEDVAIGQTGVDFFVSGCHKWMLGSRGTGLVCGKPDAWPAATPTIPSFSDRRTPGGLMTPGGFHSFEHRWALNEAFDLHLRLGKERIASHIHGLASQLKEGLHAMRHVTLHTPFDRAVSSGIVCFDVDGLAPRTVVARLRESGVVATVTPYARSHARLAPGIFNTAQEVDAALAAVRALA